MVSRSSRIVRSIEINSIAVSVGSPIEHEWAPARGAQIEHAFEQARAGPAHEAKTRFLPASRSGSFGERRSIVGVVRSGRASPLAEPVAISRSNGEAPVRCSVQPLMVSLGATSGMNG